MEALKQEYDVVIAGSGPGGATVAKELSQNGKKVLVIEWGSNAPIKGTLFQAVRMMAIPGRGLLFTNRKFLALIRGITTGGSSVFYCATAFDPPFEMLESYGIDISKEIVGLKSEIPIEPLADKLMGPMGNRIKNSAKELGYDWQKLNKFIFQDKCKTDCWKCGLGCPDGAKWNARNFIEEAIGNGATLLNCAKVKSVIIDGRKAKGVEIKKGGRTHRVEAENVILSAGGIGSAEILMRSGVSNVGKDFFVDPLITASGKVPDIKVGKELQMQAGWHVQDEYVMTDLTMPKDRNLSIMVKIKDELGGHITRNGGCRKNLTDEDKKKLKNGYAHAKKILENAGVKHISRSTIIAAHPGGTVKVGEALDSNLQTEFDNLYVCDCSVIPEAWGLPPTLTILGLGKRLARYLLTGYCG